MNVYVKLQAIVLLLQRCKAQYFQEAINAHPAQKQYFPEVQRSYYQNQYDIHDGPSNHRRYNFNSDGPGSCDCSCKKCVYKPTNCCKLICNSCQQVQPQQEFHQTMQPQLAEPQLAQFQPPSLSLFMVPLPVPYLVHPSKTESSSTTSAKSVESTTSATPVSTTTTTKRRSTTTSEITTSTTRITKTTTPHKRTKTGRQPEMLKFEKNPRCSARSQCFKNYMDYEDNLIGYKHLRSKASATVTIDSIKRNLEILNNIRPTIGMKVRSSMAHKKSLPKYGLVQILPADEAEIMMQYY